MKITPISKPKDKYLKYVFTFLAILLTPVGFIMLVLQGLWATLKEVFKDNREYLSDVRKYFKDYERLEASRRGWRNHHRENPGYYE
jgi:hypothetical protein